MRALWILSTTSKWRKIKPSRRWDASWGWNDDTFVIFRKVRGGASWTRKKKRRLSKPPDFLFCCFIFSERSICSLFMFAKSVFPKVTYTLLARVTWRRMFTVNWKLVSCYSVCPSNDVSITTVFVPTCRKGPHSSIFSGTPYWFFSHVVSSNHRSHLSTSRFPVKFSSRYYVKSFLRVVAALTLATWYVHLLFKFTKIFARWNI